MTASTCLRLTVGALLLTVSGALMAQNAETSDNASVRAGPDPSYPEVAQLDADTPIQVMGCLDDWSWCDVTFGDNRGWLYSPDITYAYQGGYVPLYSYAPGLGIPVVGFSLDVYWGSHYHNRPWYGQREEWHIARFITSDPRDRRLVPARRRVKRCVWTAPTGGRSPIDRYA